MDTLTQTSLTIASIPVLSLQRAIKRKPRFLLGVVGWFDDGERRPLEQFWTEFLATLASTIDRECGISPHLVRSDETDKSEMAPRFGKARYNLVDEVAGWRQRDLSLVSLGYNQIELLLQYGRHCDGVAMLVSKNSHDAKRLLKRVKKEVIPWIGYWTIQSEPFTSVP